MGLAREVMFSVEEDPDTDECVDPGCEDDGRDGDMVIYLWGMLMTAKQMPYCLTSIWHTLVESQVDTSGIVKVSCLSKVTGVR